MTANHLILMFLYDDETGRFFDSQKRIFLLNPLRKFELLRSMAYSLRTGAFKGLTDQRSNRLFYRNEEPYYYDKAVACCTISDEIIH